MIMILAVAHRWTWKKCSLLTTFSIVAIVASLAIAISLPLGLHLSNVNHDDNTFVYTAGNDKSLPEHSLVWLSTLSTFWYKSINVKYTNVSADLEKQRATQIYAVPIHEYHQTGVINDTCDGGSFVPPRLDVGLQVRYLYAHLPFSYHGCITNPIKNSNSINFEVAAFRLSSKQEFDRYLHYLEHGDTKSALRITPVTVVQPGESKCAHLNVTIRHTTFYYVTMVMTNDSVVSHPATYSCYSLKQYRDFDRKLHHPICTLVAHKPCFHSFYNGSFVNTHGQKLAILADVKKGSPSDVPITTVTVHASKNTNVVNLGVIIGVVVAVTVMVIILVLLIIACVRMYFSSE